MAHVPLRLLCIALAAAAAAKAAAGAHAIEPLEQPELFTFEGDKYPIRHAGELPSFRKALLRHKYSVDRFGAQTRRAALIRGVSYELCEAACTNSRCATFSYCPYTMECTVTKVLATDAALAKQLVERDSRCNIVRRDIRAYFPRNGTVVQPGAVLANREVLAGDNIADCADLCARDPTCHAYYSCGLCELQRSNDECRAQAACLIPSTINTNGTLAWTPDNVKIGTRSQPCGFYTRDYFSEYDNLTDVLEWFMLGSYSQAKFSGRSHHECAHTCASVLNGCDGYQYCRHPSGDPALSTCETFSDAQNDRWAATTRVFKRDFHCELYSLKVNSPAAQLVDMLSNGGELLVLPINKTATATAGGAPTGRQDRPSALTALYVTLVLLALALTCLLYMAAANEAVRRTVGRVRGTPMRDMLRDDDSARTQSELELETRA